MDIAPKKALFLAQEIVVGPRDDDRDRDIYGTDTIHMPEETPQRLRYVYQSTLLVVIEVVNCEQSSTIRMVHLSPRLPSVSWHFGTPAITSSLDAPELVASDESSGIRGVISRGFGLRNRLINAFKEQGLTADDIATAVVIHEAMGIFMLALTWSLCYFFPLSTFPILEKPLAKIASLMPKVIANNELLTSRLGVAYGESSCFRKLIRPFTLPTKIILTVKLVPIIRKIRQQSPFASNTVTNVPEPSTTHLTNSEDSASIEVIKPVSAVSSAPVGFSTTIQQNYAARPPFALQL